MKTCKSSKNFHTTSSHFIIGPPLTCKSKSDLHEYEPISKLQNNHSSADNSLKLPISLAIKKRFRSVIPSRNPVLPLMPNTRNHFLKTTHCSLSMVNNVSRKNYTRKKTEEEKRVLQRIYDNDKEFLLKLQRIKDNYKISPEGNFNPIKYQRVLIDEVSTKLSQRSIETLRFNFDKINLKRKSYDKFYAYDSKTVMLKKIKTILWKKRDIKMDD